ncbi:serine hydrolase domain-containing protein [Aquibaculum sediminis]|uniref:serine hydrolase domain-containing protein n=1 Tax=Aquibaculum sediminis TaxID=3231907 RepID=UPI00345152D5
MSLKVAAGAALLLLASLNIPGAAAQEETGPQPVAQAVDVAALIETVIDVERPPTVQLAISDELGTSVISLVRPEQPNAEDEGARELRFAYRSITKSFVGTVVLQLVQEGVLDLDAPLGSYLDGITGGDEVTLRQLGAMRSGLPDYSDNPALVDALLAAPEREPERSELLDLAFAQETSFEPGSAFQYSNTNTLLLGAVIEQVTGEPWSAVVRQRILEPLGLTSVHYGFSEEEPVAGAFQLEEGGVVEPLPAVAPGWFGASGAFTGTLSDLVAWGQALGSGSLLDDDIQAQRLAAFGPTDDDRSSPYYDRYGFAMGEIGGWIGHTGAGLGYQSLVMYDPGTERVVAILMNGTGENQNLPADIFQALLPSLNAQ